MRRLLSSSHKQSDIGHPFCQTWDMAVDSSMHDLIHNTRILAPTLGHISSYMGASSVAAN